MLNSNSDLEILNELDRHRIINFYFAFAFIFANIGEEKKRKEKNIPEQYTYNSTCYRYIIYLLLYNSLTITLYIVVNT